MSQRTANNGAGGGSADEAMAAEKERVRRWLKFSLRRPLAADAPPAEDIVETTSVENHPVPDDAPVPAAAMGEMVRPPPPSMLPPESTALDPPTEPSIVAVPPPEVQPRTGTSLPDDQVDVEHGRPRPASTREAVKPDPPSETTVPSVPVLQARLVEDESERPVYDAIPLASEHWAKRHQRKIVGGLVLVIAAMAVALGVAFGTGRGEDGEGATGTVIFATTPPTSSTSPTAASAPTYSPTSPSFRPTPSSLRPGGTTDSPASEGALQKYCGQCLWGQTNFVCDERVAYLVQNYELSEQQAKQAVMEQGYCIHPEFANESTPGHPFSCFADREELKAAVDDYTAGGAACQEGERECEVTEKYGWPIVSWCTSNVTDMSELFRDKDTFNDDLSSWDTSSVTTMRSMFAGASSFNGDVGNFDTSQVTSMYYMFGGASAFNRDLSNFDTSQVTSMEGMFMLASSFNADVSDFDTSAVTSMWSMFDGATSFNGEVSGFDTSNVTDMYGMFYGATSFNQDVSSWDVASVTDMRSMFDGASSFSQSLCPWGAHYSDTPSWKYEDMFNGTNCPNQGDPVGPYTNWCVSACNSTE